MKPWRVDRRGGEVAGNAFRVRSCGEELGRVSALAAPQGVEPGGHQFELSVGEVAAQQLGIAGAVIVGHV